MKWTSWNGFGKLGSASSLEALGGTGATAGASGAAGAAAAGGIGGGGGSARVAKSSVTASGGNRSCRGPTTRPSWPLWFQLEVKHTSIFTTFWFLDVSCMCSYNCHSKVCFEFRPEAAEVQIHADADFLLSRFFQQRKMRKSNQNELKSSRARNPHGPWHPWAHLEPTHPCHLGPTRAWTRPWRTRPWRPKPECATRCHVLNMNNIHR